MHNHSVQRDITQNRLLKVLSVSIFSANLCLNLCGCSTTSETFDCKVGNGVGCKSISEVNQMVEQGIIGKRAEKGMQSILPLETASLSTPVISVDSPAVERLGDKTLSERAEISLSDALTVHRMQEEHLRVWIAPFQDEQGNLHEGSVIHTVLKPGYWHFRTSLQRTVDSRVADSRVNNTNNSRINGQEDDDPTNPDLGEAN